MDHYQYSDKEFLERFLSCEMDSRLFDHEAHLRPGWLLIRQHGVDGAAEILCGSIERFDRMFDKGIKFDRAITLVCQPVSS